MHDVTKKDCSHITSSDIWLHEKGQQVNDQVQDNLSSVEDCVKRILSLLRGSVELRCKVTRYSYCMSC